jgi:class 3 adenylate cyclase/Pyruvate/2-oxoacid:ferredoxin oxidoreductase delta subunit
MVRRKSSSVSHLVNVDRDKCNNCHSCISVCPVKACIDGSGYRIDIIHERCLGCGRCINICGRKARTVADDAEEFFTDIKNEVPMVVILPPSAVTVFDDIFKLNGYLKSIGVKAVFDVSFGAELTIKSYLDFIERKKPEIVIAQPCPALVSFCEIYHPEVLPFMAPAHSPMLHTAIMIREFFPQYAKAKIAALSPCVAKKREFEDTGFIDYNITMVNFKRHLEDNYIDLLSFDSVAFDGPQAERAVGFSSPGGLTATVVRDAPGFGHKIRRIEGGSQVYHYLTEIPQMLLEKNTPLLVDCLSCGSGCNGGLGTGNTGLPIDRLEAKIEKRTAEHIRQSEQMKNGSSSIIKAGIRDLINHYWKKGLYKRVYTNKSYLMEDYKIPNENELKIIYERMKKRRQSDFLNCAACGYGSCRGMAEAIFNGLNRPENCHQYLSIELELRNRLLHETFGRYLSDDIVNSLLDDPSTMSLGGIQRNVTVLMSDLRGFTTLAESIDANKLISMMNHYFTAMVEHIHGYKGTVIEFLGDGILVVFGAPLETPNHADDAIACAIAMQNSMGMINKWNKENGIPPLSMGIGINTGECIVGNIGSDKTMKYNVIGRNVNLCGRIESYTTGDEIYISEQTKKKAKSYLQISHTEQVHPKGFPEPVSIHKVEGIGAPYSLQKIKHSALMHNLREPLRLQLFNIDEKYVGTTAHKCALLSISEHSSIIVCRSLGKLENIQIVIDGFDKNIFAKVTEELKQYCYLVTVTTNAEDFFIEVMRRDALGKEHKGDAFLKAG